jgi:hypothetical protein
MVSSFLNPREMSKLALGRLFVQRLHLELDLRNIKATLGMGQLSCETPSMFAKELGVHLLAYHLIRLLMAQALGALYLIIAQSLAREKAHYAGKW